MKFREFFIQPDKKDIQTYEYFATECRQYDDDIHAIEKNAYSRAVRALEQIYEISHHQTDTDSYVEKIIECQNISQRILTDLGEL